MAKLWEKSPSDLVEGIKDAAVASPLGGAAVLLSGSEGLSNIWQDITGQTAADKAADALRAGSAESRAIYEEQLAKLLEQQAPVLEARNAALGDLQSLMKNPSSVTKLPGYSFRERQGLKGLKNLLSSQGLSLSGKGLESVTEYGQNFATNEYNQQFDRLARLAGIGVTGASPYIPAQTNLTSGITNAIMGGAQATASQALGSYQGEMNTLNTLLQLGGIAALGGRGAAAPAGAGAGATTFPGYGPQPRY